MAQEQQNRMAYSAMHRAAADMDQGLVNGTCSGYTMANGVSHPAQEEGDQQGGTSMIHRDQSSSNVFGALKQKIASNFEHYSNYLGIPLFRRRRHSSNKSDKGEDLELEPEDYEFVESIELMHLDGFIFNNKKEPAKGHQFESVHLKNPTWCDLCSEFIWGVYKECLRCKYCQYTCHHKCRPMVTLDCKSVSPEAKAAPLNRSDTSLFDEGLPKKDDADSGYNSGRLTKQHPSPGERTLTRADLRKQIEAFNKNNYGLVMNLHETDTTFQGFIRVHMNLIRPISMSITTRPPSIYEVLTSDGQAEREDIMCQSFDSMSSSCSSLGGSSTESFYLPKDTTKVIHIKSNITTQEVIRALLHKFKITDNPRKFALYEKTMHEGQKSVMRKMQDLEYPLQLCLSWTAEGLAQKKFVLHENDTMEIVWEAFSLPELDNFLRILDREEEEYVDQVKAKYALMKIHINQRLKELAPKPPQPSGDDTRQPVFV